MGRREYKILPLWGHRAGNIPPSFVLGLRPMPRLIITYEEDRGNHDNPKNGAEEAR